MSADTQTATTLRVFTQDQLSDSIHAYVEQLRVQHPKRRLPRGEPKAHGYAEWAGPRPARPTLDEHLAAHQGSWHLALKAAGVKRAGRKPHDISPELAIEHLRAAVAFANPVSDVDETSVVVPVRLGSADYEEYRAACAPSAPTPKVLMRVLGCRSWSGLVGLVEASPRHEHRAGERRAHMAERLRDAGLQLGRAPSRQEWACRRPAGARSVTVYEHEFGGWNEAVKAAGLEPSYPTMRPLAERLADTDHRFPTHSQTT